MRGQWPVGIGRGDIRTNWINARMIDDENRLAGTARIGRDRKAIDETLITRGAVAAEQLRQDSRCGSEYSWLLQIEFQVIPFSISRYLRPFSNRQRTISIFLIYFIHTSSTSRTV